MYHRSVMMLQSYFEEYLSCVVSLGAWWKAVEMRAYLGEVHRDAERFSSMPAGEVSRYAQERISFENRAAKLKALFGVLFDCSPFADDDAERKCLDFALVRNIIAHSGGWPNESHAPQVESPNVIIESARIGESVFYRLTITPQFFGECLRAMASSVEAIERRIALDPVFE